MLLTSKFLAHITPECNLIPLTAVSYHHLKTAHVKRLQNHRRQMATASQLQTLKKYNACDISDALLKLSVPNAGFLPDLNPVSHSSTSSPAAPLIAPASTIVFASRYNPEANVNLPEANIPKDCHYVDLTEEGSIVVSQQPEGQKCAILGGIMAARMKKRGAKGVIVLGRVRDVGELRATGLEVIPFLHVWSRIVLAGCSNLQILVALCRVLQKLTKPLDMVKRNLDCRYRSRGQASCHTSSFRCRWNYHQTWGPRLQRCRKWRGHHSSRQSW